MTPLRNAPFLFWETAYSFEDATNMVKDVVHEHELFIPDLSDGSLSEGPAELESLLELAKRQIISVWTRERPSRTDEKSLQALADTCHTRFALDGATVVRTEHLDELNKRDPEGRPGNGIDGLIWAMKDGLCEWILRGRTRDVRACLWHGGLFRADRANAVFCQPKCRTAYHRAIGTAEEASVQRETLLGIFRCVECERKLLINAASGLIQDGEGVEGVYVGNAINYRSICRACVEQNHPAWSGYIVPMIAAA